MATCPYCLEAIADHARKCRHCHSYLDKDLQPKGATDLADFVIKFVGFSVGALGVLGVAAAALFAAFGIKSFDDLKSQLKNDIQALRQNEIESLKSENARLIEDVRASLIDASYERYERIFHYLVIDEVTEQTLGELQLIHGRIKNLKSTSSTLVEKVSEMDSVIEALMDYKVRDFENAHRKVNATKASTAARYRMLCSVDSKLFLKYLERGMGSSADADQARKYLADLDDCTKTYLQLDTASELPHMMRAIALKRKARVAQDAERANIYQDAIKELKTAGRFAPGRGVINYNLAAVYMALGRLDEALSELDEVKQKGDLSRPGDIDFFKKDDDFATLWASTDSNVQQKLNHLIGKKS